MFLLTLRLSRYEEKISPQACYFSYSILPDGIRLYSTVSSFYRPLSTQKQRLFVNNIV